MSRAKIVDRTLYGVDVVIFSVERDVLKVLMLKRNVPEEKFTTGWEFVKGALEDDETFLEAAKREIKEETGLNPIFIKELQGEIIVDVRYRKKPHYDYVKKRALVFLYTDGKITIDPKEHDDWTWMEYKQAHECIWVDKGQEILEKSMKALMIYLESREVRLRQ